MGGDSAGVNGWLGLTILKNSKVFVRDEMIFGCCGEARILQILNHQLEIPYHKTNVSLEKYIYKEFSEAVRECFKDCGFSEIKNNKEETPSGSEFLLGYRGHLFMVGSDFCVLESSKPYMATGCGGDYALGALCTVESNLELTAEERVRLALETAERLNAGVRAPFTVLSIGGEE
jgi:ATP-dependent protease HslVU (ClpYQ) peptidase subunit